MQNKKNVMIVVGIIVLVGVFYVGMSYGKSQVAAKTQTGQGGQTFGQNGRGTGGMRNGGFGGLTSGEIIAKDAQSITIKMRDGSSKIVFYTDKIAVEKNVSGNSADLVVGKQVSVVGTANPDGSETAQSVQIRPNMPAVPASTTAPVPAQ